MHRLEIRLGSTEEPAAEFEIYTERMKDGKYESFEEPLAVNSENPPIVKLLEGDERVVIVAKAKKYKMVFDKEQNANIRVEDDDVKPAPKEKVEASKTAQFEGSGVKSFEPPKSFPVSGMGGGPKTSNPQGAQSSKEIKG